TIGHEDISRLDIPMRDSLLVRSLQSIRYLNGQLDQTTGGKRLAGDVCSQCLAIQKLHDNEWPSFVFIDGVEGANIGMIQRGSSSGFAPKSLECHRILRPRSREEFERDQST